MNWYEPTIYDKTYTHKLEGITIKELDQMKQANKDKIRQIEEKFFNVDSKSVNV